MNRLKVFVLTACLALPTPLLVTGPVAAESASPAASPAAKADANKAAAPMKAEDDDSKMSETDKRAKAIECSKQADAKKLHGEARKKFRSSCKRGK